MWPNVRGTNAFLISNAQLQLTAIAQAVQVGNKELVKVESCRLEETLYRHWKSPFRWFQPKFCEGGWVVFRVREHVIDTIRAVEYGDMHQALASIESALAILACSETV